jgi:hypothetical protein
MSKPFHKLEWCVVRLGKDLNWWVEEISDPIAWDVEGLAILDPKQSAYILDLMEPMREYSLQEDLREEAFFKFRIDKDMGNGKIRLVRVVNDILEPEEPIFLLPDVVDDEKSAYADFLDHLTKVRVKMLNDLIDFKQRLTIDEIEEAISETHHSHFLEFKSVHVFNELRSIIEYIPPGFESDLGHDDDLEEPEADDSLDIPTNVLVDIEEEDDLFEELSKDNAQIGDAEEGGGAGGADNEHEDFEDLDDLNDDDHDDDFLLDDDVEVKPKAKAPAKKSAVKTAPAKKTATKAPAKKVAKPVPSKSKAAEKAPAATKKTTPSKKTTAKAPAKKKAKS